MKTEDVARNIMFISDNLLLHTHRTFWRKYFCSIKLNPKSLSFLILEYDIPHICKTNNSLLFKVLH